MRPLIVESGQGVMMILLTEDEPAVVMRRRRHLGCEWRLSR